MKSRKVGLQAPMEKRSAHQARFSKITKLKEWFKNLKTSTKIKLGVASVATITLIGVSINQLHTISTNYSNIKTKKVQNFSTLWASIWDDKDETFNDKLDRSVVQQLSKQAATPTQRERLRLAQASVDLMNVNTNTSTLTQYVAAANNYYANKDADDDYKKQETLNESILTHVENLIVDVSNNLNQLSLAGNQIDFGDRNLDSINLTTIATDLPWKDLKVFNKHLAKLNTLIATQRSENKKAAEQQRIINLKDELESFVEQAKTYESTIKSNYITIKELRSILSTLSNSDPSKHESWFEGLRSYDLLGTPASTNATFSAEYTTKLTSEFFEDNPSLKAYKDALSQLSIPVSQQQTVSTTSYKSDETKKQTYRLSINTSVSADNNDDDLVNTNSLRNIVMSIEQNQTIKQYKAPETRPSQSTSGSSSHIPFEPNTNTDDDASSTESSSN